MRHNAHHCDHWWSRDDANCKVCLNCGKRKEDKCLGLAANRTEDSETREQVGEARILVQQLEEYEGWCGK